MSNIIITESTKRNIIGKLLSESFSPKLEQVKVIKEYLDKWFIKQYVDDIDENGEPTVTPMFLLLSKGERKPIKSYTAHDLLLKLDSNFHNFIKKDTDRINFLKQVITDWSNNQISNTGQLTKNMIHESKEKSKNKSSDGKLSCVGNELFICLHGKEPHREIIDDKEKPVDVATCYKLFRYDPYNPGKLFPLFVETSQTMNDGLEIGKWYKCGVGELWGRVDIKGKNIDPKTVIQNYDKSPNKDEFIENLKKNYPINLNKVESKLGKLSYRPGWHGASLPMADHIGPEKSVYETYKDEIEKLRPNIVEVNENYLPYFKKTPVCWYSFGSMKNILNYDLLIYLINKEDIIYNGKSFFEMIGEKDKKTNTILVYKKYKKVETMLKYLNSKLNCTICKYINVTGSGEKNNFYIWNGKEYTDTAKFRDKNQVFAECHIGADRHDIVQKTASEAGKSAKDQCIKDINKLSGGYYEYKTNSSANDSETWIIADSIMIKRILTDKEKDAIINKEYKPDNEYMRYNVPRIDGSVVDNKKIKSMGF